MASEEIIICRILYNNYCRSNSEEKLNSQNDYGYQNSRTQNSSIRRVNSHEDCRSNLRKSCQLSQTPRTDMDHLVSPFSVFGRPNMVFV